MIMQSFPLGYAGVLSQNEYGQVTGTPSSECKPLLQMLPPLAAYTVLQIACGHKHTIALTADGLCYAFGSDSYGQARLRLRAGTVG